MPIVDPKVEIEFTAGSWTDVTADVDLSENITIKYGRTSEFSDAQTGACDFQLANHLGKYTPKAQLLADGTTAHPFYPNVVPRKRVRVSNTSGNRFLGYIKSWAPILEGGVRALMLVSASDRQDQFSRINLLSFYEHELAPTTPAYSYLMNDVPAATGASAVFLDTSGNGNPPLSQVRLINATFTPGLANPMPQSDGLVGVGVSSATAGNGASIITRGTLDAANFAFSAWVTVPKVAAASPVAGTAAVLCAITDANAFYGTLPEPTTDVEFDISYGTGGSTITIGAGAFAGAGPAQLGSTITGSAPDDGLPHHYMLICSTSGGTQTLTLYIDGVSQGGTSFVSGQLNTPTWHSLAVFGGAGTDKAVVIGPTAGWAYAPAITLPDVLTQAGNGFAGEKTGARVARLLRYIGLTSGDYVVDAGQEVMSGAQGIRGKSLLLAGQEVAITEGGGSTFYMNTNGLVRFCDRTFRKPAAPNLTLSAQLDLDGPFTPTLDDMTLINQSAVTRADGNTFTATDAASVTAFGISTDSATSYASTDAAALSLAQQRVSAQSAPGIRVPQFTVDLITSNVAASALAGLQIGWRARITGLPVGINAASQMDVIIEGWSETISKTSWTLAFDASPADSPARFIWDDPKYGRWGAGTTMTLTSGITASATSISVTTAASKPTFTLAAGAYPMPIKIGEEEMTITSAPGSSASPQALTVTRGASGTKAAPQSAGAQVSLSPNPAWSL